MQKKLKRNNHAIRSIKSIKHDFGKKLKSYQAWCAQQRITNYVRRQTCPRGKE